MPLTISTALTGATQIFFEDDGTVGNATSRLRWAGGSTPVAYPGDSITINSTLGQSFTIDLIDSLTTSTLAIGNLTNVGVTPDNISVRRMESAAAMTLVASKAISEGGKDAATDITASSVILSAGTGIGASNAIETQVATLEAETNKGNINIANYGTVTIGGLTADVSGLAVANKGDASVTAYGSIVLSDTTGSAGVVSGANGGDVILTAKGISSQIFSNVDHDAISAAKGDIRLTAGSHIAFGQGTDYDNDVRANGSITISTQGYLYLDGFADMASNDFGGNTGKGVKVTAANGIYVLDSYGTDASISANGTGGGDVVLIAGGGSQFNISAVSAATIFSSSGDVSVSANSMLIATDSGITANSGSVTLKTTTHGWRIDLGTVSDSSVALGLSDAELDRIFTPQLTIGSADAGAVTFTSSISPLNAADLTVQSGENIVVNGGLSVTTTGRLLFQAADDIIIGPGAFVQGSVGLTGFIDWGNTDNGHGGKAIVSASFGATVRFFGNKDGDTLFGGAAADILDGRQGADKMTGRNGNDIYYVDNNGDKVTESSGAGEDTIRSSITLTLGANVENLELQGNNNLKGTGNGLGNDLTGNAGNNELKGLGGADRIGGLRGDDILTGGGGADSFLFTTALNAATNVDKITDFSVASDTIELENAIFDALGLGTLSAGAFRKGAAAADASDRIIYNQANGWLSYDEDGKNGDAAIHFATLKPGLAVTNADFLVV